MIQVLAIITTKPGKRDEVLGHFRANMPAVHAEAGCIEYGPVIDAEGGAGAKLAPIRSSWSRNGKASTIWARTPARRTWRPMRRRPATCWPTAKSTFCRPLPDSFAAERWNTTAGVLTGRISRGVAEFRDGGGGVDQTFCRKGDCRPGAGARLAFQPQRTAVQFHDRLDQRQPKAGSLMLAAERGITCSNASTTRPIFSGAMPMPVSATVSASPRCASTRQDSSIVPPGGVNLTALVTRFSSTCRTLSSSARNSGMSVGKPTISTSPRRGCYPRTTAGSSRPPHADR